MSTLQLTIPAQQARRSSVRIKPAEVHSWLDDLPYMDLRRAARMASEQLRLMNRQIIPTSARLSILDAFLHSHHRLLDALPQRLSSKDDTPQQIKRLTQDIGFGYKIIAQELAGKSGSRLLNNRNLAAALNGSLYNLGIQLRHYYERHQKAPRSIWDECLMLYRFARAYGLEHKRKAFPDNQEYDIEESFLLIALLRITDPYRLSPGMVPTLTTYFRKHVQLCRLVPEQSLDEHLIPLEPAEELAINVLYLDPAGLNEQVSADIATLEKTGQTVAIGLPAEIPPATLLRTLQQLVELWKNAHSRVSERQEAQAAIELVTGIDASYCFVNQGRCFDPTMYLKPGYEDEIDLANPAHALEGHREAPTPFSCYSLNRSDGGLSIRYRGIQQPHPVAGQLIAIHRPGSRSGKGWVIGVCRWLVKAADDAGFDLGLQYLVREPVASVVRALEQSGPGGDYQPAISALQQRAGQPVATLIVAAEFLPGIELELSSAKGKQRVRCSELLDSGPGFYRYIYEPVQGDCRTWE